MVDDLDKATTKVVEVVSEGRILKPEDVLAMIDDVDYYAEAELVSKMVEETKKKGMDFAVHCMASGIKIDASGEGSNPVIEEIRDSVWTANVDFAKLTKTVTFNPLRIKL
ncbi:hypothetical protein Pmar_PMAR022022 [Perkinsus marinus ATCC 50983]|uniref:Uncharacterized protein n=1 Tax=Perkinsus marinus (strain ATCC 50983 / TXsc) TaxID=423536 RepID=C5L630_PERM5|nr:hypothetical protein Pmar_PMAR022022 [Perkinsus marinus ATCC 50983]EER07815.1 hypothetical protein Pmar_PMAR022022 [Perkinsus marinus ATCC 50983]|eukprot:XP_002775999.1 hypothetical protein Pmar_PMAR022022 [Perkinsus marinus ATCC 50983]